MECSLSLDQSPSRFGVNTLASRETAVRIGGDSGKPIVQRKEGAAFLELARNAIARTAEVSAEAGPKIEISD